MHIDRDLFGEPIAAATALPRVRKIGYAARPGTGPRNQRCNTCAHCIPVMQEGRRGRKCELVAPLWTTTAETDVKHNAPACRLWERKSYEKTNSLNP